MGLLDELNYGRGLEKAAAMQNVDRPYVAPTLTQICDEKILYHKSQLALLEEAKKLLESNKDFQKLIQLMNSVR